MIAGLYHIVEQSKERIVLKLAPENHPLFRAHFPGNPILPGFAQIEIIAEILKDDIARVKYSKFISHLFPDDMMVCDIKKEGTKTKITILRESKKVSEIAYES